MAMERNDLISTLNQLIQTCRDGEEGYKQAAEAVEDPELIQLFNNYSAQRGSFAAELQEEVARLGGDPQESGSMLGAIHRGWISLRDAIATRDEAAVISECERGEDGAVSTYKEVWGQDLPSDIREVVGRQFTAIQEAHDTIRGMERYNEVAEETDEQWNGDENSVAADEETFRDPADTTFPRNPTVV